MVRRKRFIAIIEEKETLSTQNKVLEERCKKIASDYDVMKSQLESENSISKDTIDKLNDDLNKMAGICRILVNTDKTLTPIQIDDSNFDHIIEKLDLLLEIVSDPNYKIEDHTEINENYLRDSNRILKFVNVKLANFEKCLKERQSEKIRLEMQTTDNTAQIEWLERIIDVSKVMIEKINKLVDIINNK